jgi:hypothetical protein
MNITNLLGPHAPETQKVLGEAWSASAQAPVENREASQLVGSDALVVCGPSSAESSWLTSPDQCATANEESLRRALLTVDGAGRAVKTAALNELLRRHAEAASVRQPTDNVADEPRA